MLKVISSQIAFPTTSQYTRKHAKGRIWENKESLNRERLCSRKEMALDLVSLSVLFSLKEKRLFKLEMAPLLPLAGVGFGGGE